MDIKEFVKNFYEVIISDNRLGEIEDYIAKNCTVKVGEQIVSVGVDKMREHIKATKSTYPDYTMRIIGQYQDGDTVISEFIMTGTHRGKFLGITPTNKVISITGVDIDKVVDGKIVEHGGAANTFDAFYENHLIVTV